jgi:hypothetical protein
VFKLVAGAISAAGRKLAAQWPALLVAFGLYAALLGALYFFFTTRDATVGQLMLTLLLAVVAVALFFVLQALGVSYARSEGGTGALLRRAVADFWKLFVMSLPLLLLGGLLGYLFNKLGGGVAVTALRWLLLGLALPLVAIHWWMAAAREGVAGAFRGAGRSLARAFAPGPVLTYALGLLVSGLIAYFLISTRTPVRNAWVELGLLGARLALALIAIFSGWLLTLGALAEIDAQRGKE